MPGSVSKRPGGLTQCPSPHETTCQMCCERRHRGGRNNISLRASPLGLDGCGHGDGSPGGPQAAPGPRGRRGAARSLGSHGTPGSNFGLKRYIYRPYFGAEYAIQSFRALTMTPDNIPTKAQALKVHWWLIRTRYRVKNVFVLSGRERKGYIH